MVLIVDNYNAFPICEQTIKMRHILFDRNLNFFQSLASITCLLVILTISIQPYCQPVDAREQPDLYSATDNVLRLTGETFEPTVFKSSSDITYVVEFYNTFCGHCQVFAPIYKEIAVRLKNWSSVVRIAGVDCSKYENVETCSDNKIEGYPTIFIFAPHSKYKDPKDAPFNLRSLNIEWTVDDIEESIITYVGNLTQTNRTYPQAVNAMIPIQVKQIDQVKRLYTRLADFDEFLNEPGSSAQDLMIIVESDKSYLGRKLIIEYFRIQSKLELRRISLDNEDLLRNILHPKDYAQLGKNQPLLLRMNSLERDSKAQVLVRGEAGHILPTVEEAERQDFILNRFKTFLDHYYSVELKEITGHDVDKDSPKSAVSRTKVDTNEINQTDKTKQQSDLEINYLIHSDPIGRSKIFAQDLLKGISYMITHEMRVKGDLKPKEFNTIRNMLTVLRKYLPLDKWDLTMSKFIENLRLKLDENRATYDKNGISSQQMRDLLDFSGSDGIRMKYNDESWISCYDSERQHKGYTCSLWLLFHSLTVGEYSKAAPVRFKPTLVLTTMRDYITKFLGCTVCSSNFVKETQNLESNLVARNSSVLWLWNTHNRVNQRLNNEKPGNHRRPLSEVIYPTEKQCPQCYQTSSAKMDHDGKKLDDIEWNLPQILEHMVELYRPNNVVTPSELSTILRGIRNKMSYEWVDGPFSADLNSSSPEKWNIQSIFSAKDMSICLFLYLFCIIIVAMVCLILNPKWKRSNGKTK